MINENIQRAEIVRLPYESALTSVNDEVEKAISASPFVVRQYLSHLLGASGKMIRAQALLACAEDEENLISESAVKVAAAIEILHLATLVHDDIIDDSDTRRGIPTLQKKYGKRVAVICGDYLLSLALKIAANVADKQNYSDMILPDYVGKICYGELYQYINNGNLDLSVYQYLKIISGKTAALFEASFFAGAVLSGCDKKEYMSYRKLGKYIGMIFQLTDDCMDLEATEEVAKKPVQSDFTHDVVTLPLIHALKTITGFREKVKKGEMSGDELKSAVMQSDGLSYTRLVAKKYYKKAVFIIEKLTVNEEKKTKLLEILEKSYRVF